MIHPVCVHIPSDLFCYVLPVFATHVTQEMTRNTTVLCQILDSIKISQKQKKNCNLKILKTLKNAAYNIFCMVVCGIFINDKTFCFGNVFDV